MFHSGAEFLVRTGHDLSHSSDHNDFPGSSVIKNPPASARDMSSIPGLQRSPGEGNGNPLQNCCLGNPIDRGTWQAIVHGVAKSQTQLSKYHTFQ